MLQNLPGQLLALVLGWSFTVFLQYVLSRRAEALKRKDKIIDKLEDLSSWIDSEISRDEFMSAQTETSYSGMISQIEVRIQQLNAHVRKEIFNVNELSKLRGVEILDEQSGNKNLPYVVREAASDIIEAIEANCDEEYFGRKGFVQFLNNYIRELNGFILLMISALLLMAVAQFFIKHIF